MIDYVAAIRSESARFGELIASTPMDAPVPSCPDWTVAELAWHLTEVQDFWGSIVEALARDPDSTVPVERPVDDSLPALFDARSARLIDALAARSPDEACWSWYHAGHTVGWVRRRQAQEALIHRVDTELAAGAPSAIDPILAGDGVDEILRVMLDVGVPGEWASYQPDGATATIETADDWRTWSMDFGRFKGTNPESGNTHDLPALRLIDPVDEPTVRLRGSAADLDLWLWGRGPLDPIAVMGDPAIADQLRATAADSTQ